MEILRNATKHLTRVAVAADGQIHRYGEVFGAAARTSRVVADLAAGSNKPQGPGEGPRVAVMAPPGRAHVEALWSTWLSGGIAVPLALTHPPKELDYVLRDAECAVVLTGAAQAAQMRPLAEAAGAALHVIEHSCPGGPPPAASSVDGHASAQAAVADMERCVAGGDGAAMIYTSGTTGRPKGALHTQDSLAAQIRALLEAWDWAPRDRLLHALPLHHVHGAVVGLHTAHAAGAAVEFLPKFSATEVWQRLQRQEHPVTVFMGVPTMYAHLLTAYDAMAPDQQRAARAAAARLRLTVSGSAPCPIPLMERWERLSGTRLLERYGMTETGMVLSNPLRGERRPGAVGLPLPGVVVRCVPDEAADAAADGAGAGGGSGTGSKAEQGSSGVDSGASTSDGFDGPGELRVKGPNLFKEYWRRPEATRKEFDEQGFFKTGDIVVREGSPPYWRILGRASADIIKSAGYKISALSIENVLLEHPDVTEVAVLGVPDDGTYGEIVAAVVACKMGSYVDLSSMQDFARERLPPYQLPRVVRVVPEIPRNAMGKVNKKQLRAELFGPTN